MTACGSTDLAVEAMKKGASDFLSKPFFVNDFIKSIEYVNKKRSLDREKAELIVSLKLKANEQEEELKGMYFSVLSSLAQAMEKKDIGTYGHSKTGGPLLQTDSCCHRSWRGGQGASESGLFASRHRQNRHY